MLHAVVLGGTGRVGSYLVPRLLRDGHAVTVVTRGKRQPSVWDNAWAAVPGYPIDRGTAALEGVFGDEIAALAPDVVVDLLTPRMNATRQLAEALADTGVRLIQLGTIAVHGPCGNKAVAEEDNLAPLTPEGQAALSVQRFLLKEQETVEACVILAGHLVGPGGCTLNPAGNFDDHVWAALRGGGVVVLPGNGEARLQLVHAEDVADLILRCVNAPEKVRGHSFHAVAPPLSQQRYAEAVVAPDTRIRFIDVETWAQQTNAKAVATTQAMLQFNANCSGKKALQQLGFSPRWDPLETARQ